MNFCVTKMFDSLIKRKKYIKAEKKLRSYVTVNINSKNLNESAKKSRNILDVPIAKLILLFKC